MRGTFLFITLLSTVDAFFGGFAFGFNTRHCLVIDPTMPPVKHEAKKSEAIKNVTVSDIEKAPESTRDSIKRAAGSGVIKLGKDSAFNPDQPVTRGDFISWVAAVRKLPAATPKSPTFADVPAKNPNYQAVEKAVKAQLLSAPATKGKGKKPTFNAAKTLTREELAEWYCKLTGEASMANKLTSAEVDEYLSYNPASSTRGDKIFGDAAQISAASKKYVALANKHGILKQVFGTDPYDKNEQNTYLLPKQTVRRAQAIQMLMTIIKE